MNGLCALRCAFRKYQISRESLFTHLKVMGNVYFYPRITLIIIVVHYKKIAIVHYKNIYFQHLKHLSYEEMDFVNNHSIGWFIKIISYRLGNTHIPNVLRIGPIFKVREFHCQMSNLPFNSSIGLSSASLFNEIVIVII